MSLADRPIDDTALQRLRSLAPAALARRNSAYFLPQWLRIVATPIHVCIGLWCLMQQQWQPAALILLFLVGVWAGMIADALRVFALAPWLAQTVNGYNDDRWVFELVSCLRKGERKYRADLTVPYQPRTGLFFDVAFGFMSTLTMVVWLNQWGAGSLGDQLRDPGTLWLLAMVTLVPLGSAIVQVLTVRLGPPRPTAVMVASGERGLGLFVLMIVFALCVEGFGLREAVAGWSFLFSAWGLSLLLAVLMLVALRGSYRDRDWLQRWLAQEST